MFEMFKQSRQHLLRKATVAVLSGTVLAWIIYVLLGYWLLEIAYNSTSLPIIDRVLSGRRVTPLAEYYRAANTVLVDLTGRTLFLLLCVALFVFGITRPRRLVPLSVLILTSSFSVFWLLEVTRRYPASPS